jgi:hypothetical protein
MRWLGLAKAAAQVHFAPTAYNLKRTLNILPASQARLPQPRTTPSMCRAIRIFARVPRLYSHPRTGLLNFMPAR